MRLRMKTDRKKSTKGTLLISVGLLLIAAALILVIYNVWDAKRAAKESEAIVEKLETVIGDSQLDQPTYTDPEKEMPTKEIDGYSYIGILDIPTLGLHLPVMESWNYERLSISPCRYTGSYYSDDMVICAHNYAKHFSPIKWIDIGTDVYFTTVEGIVYHYQVSNRETLPATAVEDMIDQTKEEWNLTLFTCNTSGQARCVVRCMRVQER